METYFSVFPVKGKWPKEFQFWENRICKNVKNAGNTEKCTGLEKDDAGIVWSIFNLAAYRFQP